MKYYVTSLTGGYVETFDWLEAEEIAIDESKGTIRFIMDEDNHIAALFYDGERFIKASGQSCERCGKQIDTDSAHYAYHLTGRFFCSSDCGVKLGVLRQANP